MRILVCNYTGFRSNWGSQATSRGLLQLLHRTFAKDGQVQIDILPYPPTHWLDNWQEKRHGQLLADIYANAAPNLDQLRELERLAKIRFGILLDRVREADVVFFQGEGALGNGREFRRTQMFAPPLLAKHLYGKTVISINQSVTFHSTEARQSLQTIFGAFDRNYVRELESLETCHGEEWPDFGFIPDAALFYQPRAASAQAMRAPYFCVTGSADLSSYDIDAYVNGIHEVATRCKLHPVFLYSRSSDSIIVDTYRKIRAGNFSIINSKTHPDVDQILPILSGAQVVIGGRYHTSISALSRNVPVILTASNSRKSVGLARMFGEDNVELVDRPTPETLMSAIQPILRDRAALQGRIAAQLAKMQQTANAACTELHQLLSPPEMQIQWSKRGHYPDPALHIGRRALIPLKAVSLRHNLRHYDRRSLIELKLDAHES